MGAIAFSSLDPYLLPNHSHCFFLPGITILSEVSKAKHLLDMCSRQTRGCIQQETVPRMARATLSAKETWEESETRWQKKLIHSSEEEWITVTRLCVRTVWEAL